MTDSAYEIAKPTRPLDEEIRSNIIINTSWMLSPWHLKFHGNVGLKELKEERGRPRVAYPSGLCA